MKKVGVVAEYNPFHAGHRWHISETRRRLGECVVMAVMSGNFVQRGECAVWDKWRRAADALRGGVDLVLELPTVWAASSAEHFAGGAVAILREAGAEVLSFGSESGESGGLLQAAQCLASEAFQAELRGFLDQGLPFAACRQAAAEALLGKEAASCLLQPNDNLAVEYLKAAGRLRWDPQVAAVPRLGAAHDGGAHPLYPSASYLRKKILEDGTGEGNPASLHYHERGVLSRLRRMDVEEFEALPDSGEGLANRLHHAARQAVTLPQLYALAKTKRYAHARIRRMVLWAWLGLRESDRPRRPPYLRVLAANERGRAALRELRTGLPVITKPAYGKGLPLLELEARCTDLYALCRRQPVPCGAEWSTSPVIR